MTTLLLTLSGPQQAWGSRSRFTTRSTDLAPTRSGVIGLIAAALGMERTASLERFTDLAFGVRVDQPGNVERDFQTTRSLDGSKSFPLSERFFLSDAVFVVGLEGRDGELSAYRQALRRPHFPLFLGRRAFPPDGPILTALVDLPLREALAAAPWAARPHHRRTIGSSSVHLAVFVDAAAGEPSGDSRDDVPVTFDPRRRQYARRDVTTYHVSVPHPDPEESAGGRTSAGQAVPARLLGSPTDHDAMSLLSDEEV